MKKVLSLVALAMISTIMFAVNDGAKTNQNKKEAKSGEVIVMNKEMFINDVFDYQNSKEWKYKGDKPCYHRLICRLVWSLPHDSPYHEIAR